MPDNVLLLSKQLERERQARKEAEDILEQKSLELFYTNQNLRDKEAQTRTILEAAADGIIAVRADGTIIFNNTAAEVIFGYTKGMLEKRNVETLIQASENERSRKTDWVTLLAMLKLKGKRGVQEFIGNRQDGVHFPLELTVSETTFKKEAGYICIIRDITERKEAEQQLSTLHAELLKTSRRAGMADVATSILHNVGNVLNSVNVTTLHLIERVHNSRLAGLSKVKDILSAHAQDFTHFITNDPQGKHLPFYLSQLSECWSAEQEGMLKNLTTLAGYIEQIKNIVAMQQSLSGVSSVTEPVLLSDAVEEALFVIMPTTVSQHEFIIIREYAPHEPILIDKIKLQQILINLLQNARDSLNASAAIEKQLTLKIHFPKPGIIQLCVTDNGLGIDALNLAKIFSHGFTTKANGHGFGLHTSALAAKEMNGSLSANSEGANKGATFVLDLPYQPLEQKKTRHG